MVGRNSKNDVRPSPTGSAASSKESIEKIRAKNDRFHPMASQSTLHLDMLFPSSSDNIKYSMGKTEVNEKYGDRVESQAERLKRLDDVKEAIMVGHERCDVSVGMLEMKEMDALDQIIEPLKAKTEAAGKAAKQLSDTTEAHGAEAHGAEMTYKRNIDMIKELSIELHNMGLDRAQAIYQEVIDKFDAYYAEHDISKGNHYEPAKLKFNVEAITREYYDKYGELKEGPMPLNEEEVSQLMNDHLKLHLMQFKSLSAELVKLTDPEEIKQKFEFITYHAGFYSTTVSTLKVAADHLNGAPSTSDPSELLENLVSKNLLHIEELRKKYLS